MGSDQSKHSDITKLSDNQISLLMNATDMTRDKIVQWHGNFLARIYNFILSYDFLTNLGFSLFF
jgi:hypothetical protein